MWTATTRRNSPSLCTTPSMMYLEEVPWAIHQRKPFTQTTPPAAKPPRAARLRILPQLAPDDSPEIRRRTARADHKTDPPEQEEPPKIGEGLGQAQPRDAQGHPGGA